MAASLLALLDDITTVLDDVAVLTKVAVKKTAGVVGDDLALNANQVSGVRADRELPVVWAVAKGSLWNKAILVPSALLMGAFAPWSIPPMLILGGLYLCFEGAEKIFHKIYERKAVDGEKEALHAALLDPSVSMVDVEKEKIKGAIRTDFVLSAEIIVISMGSAAFAASSTLSQALTLTLIAVGMTVFVYGLVACIVKLDDFGLSMTRRASSSAQRVGQWILSSAPRMMSTLSFVGTVAMFTVGGGILAHSIPAIGHELDSWTGWASLGASAAVAVLGVVAGLLLVALSKPVKKIVDSIRSSPVGEKA